MLPLLIGNDNIPKIFVDSHTKRPELRESYQLQELRFAFILFSAVQVLRRGGEVQLPVRRKWVRASARKHAFGSRSRQAKRSACPTQGWVKLPPHHCQLLSVLRGDVVWPFMHNFRPLGSRRCGLHFRRFAAPPLRPTTAALGMGQFCRTDATQSEMVSSGVRILPRLCLRHTDPDTAKQGGNWVRMNAEREKCLFFVFVCQKLTGGGP